MESRPKNSINYIYNNCKITSRFQIHFICQNIQTKFKLIRQNSVLSIETNKWNNEKFSHGIHVDRIL